MPTVPTYDQFRATPGGTRQRLQAGALDSRAPTPQFKTQTSQVDMSVRGGNVSPTLLSGITEEFATQGGRQITEQAKAIGAVGNTVGDIALDMAQQANRTRVNDLLNQAREQAAALTDGEGGYRNIKQRDVLLDPATGKPREKPMADDYAERFKGGLDELSGQLTNPDQRAAFGEQARGLLTSFYTGALSHENREFQTYQQSTAEGTIAMATRTLAGNYTDPVNVAESTANIKGAVYDLARLQGYSQTWADDKAFTLISGAHKDAIGAALESKNLTFANAYLVAHSKEMTPDDLLAARSVLNDVNSINLGTQAGLEVAGAAISTANPTDFGRMVAITMGPGEGTHGKDRYENGKLIVSPKGATGRMQVMPLTNTDPGFGVRPAKDDSDEERARVGRDYLGAMLKRYGGDPAKAWAAYNAGPGRLDDAIKAHGVDWLDHMPAETQGYVGRTMKALGSGGGAPPAPTLQATLAPLYADARLRSDPKALSAAVSVATRQFEANKAATTQRQTEAQGEATRLISEGTPFEQLPATVRNALDPKDIPSLESYSEKKAKGTPVQTDWQLYNQLVTDPKFLRSVNLDTLKAHLDEPEFKSIVDKRAALENGTEDQTSIASLSERVNMKLREVGIDPAGKNKDAAAKGGRIRQFVERGVRRLEEREKRKAKPEEIQAVVNRAFVEVPYGNGWAHPMTPIGLIGGDGTGYRDGADVIVPKAERPRLEAALRAQKLPLTESNMRTLFMTTQIKKAGY